MADRRWRGDAPAVSQISTVQVTGYDAATTYRLTMNGKTVSTIAQGSVNATATALAANWNALSTTNYPEFAEVTATAGTDTVTLTADTAGKPFTCTSSVSGGTGTIGSVTQSTASSGPNHWDTAANWSGAAVPTGADVAYLENSAVDILYGLDQNTVTLTALHILASYTGRIGIAEHNGTYFEYRDTYLKISATNLYIGQGVGTGSGLIKINTGTVQTAVHVYHTASSRTTGIEAFLWKGTHASSVLNVYKGSVGVAVIGGETATIATLRVGYVTSIIGDATVRLGSGCTLTTISQSGGDLTVNSASTTITSIGGVVRIRLAATVTTMNLDGGTCYYVSTGTLATVNVGANGKLLFTQDMQARTVTTCNAFAKATILDPFRTVTWTNGIDLERCGIQDVTLDVGKHVKLTPAAPS